MKLTFRIAGFLLLGIGAGLLNAATPVEIRIVAFGGKVTIIDDDDKAIAPEKGTVIPVGSTISTGANSWVDLAQGGVSTIRVKARTEKFIIRKSAFEEKKRRSFSLFKLLKGAIYVRTNKTNLTEGSKYEIQMPELITGVVGSEGECATGANGSVVHNVEGHWTGNDKPLNAGQSMVASEAVRAIIVATPANVTAALRATADTMCTVKGGATEGAVSGGTSTGAKPGASAVSPACDPGSLLPTDVGGGSTPKGGGRSTGRDVVTQTARDTAQSTAKDVVKDVGRPPPGGGGGPPISGPPPSSPPPCP